MAPKRVSNLKSAISPRLTPMSLRQSSKSPTQSLKVPIFATFPGINEILQSVMASASFRRRGRPRHTPLFCCEVCRPLFYVCSQTFFRVVALEQYLLVLAFNCQRRLHWNFPSGLHGSLYSSHCFCGLIWGAELAGVFHNIFHEVFAVEDVINNSQLFRFFE